MALPRISGYPFRRHRLLAHQLSKRRRKVFPLFVSGTIGVYGDERVRANGGGWDGGWGKGGMGWDGWFGWVGGLRGMGRGAWVMWYWSIYLFYLF